MADIRSTSEDRQEPPRPQSIPDDFVWDPEVRAWYAPGEPSQFDTDAWAAEFRKELEEIEIGRAHV